MLSYGYNTPSFIKSLGFEGRIRFKVYDQELRNKLKLLIFENQKTLLGFYKEKTLDFIAGYTKNNGIYIFEDGEKSTRFATSDKILEEKVLDFLEKNS